MTEDASKPGPRVPTIALLGGRIGHHTAIYVSTVFVNVGVGLAGIAVITRFLDPSVFGDLTVLLFLATVLTVIYNAGSLQGTLSWVYGQTGDEDVGISEAATPGRTAADPRRALTTGLLFTAGIAAVGTLLVAWYASDLADLLIHDADAGQAVTYAAAAGGLASVWRLAANNVRLQRRPVAYLVSNAIHSVGGLLATIPFLESGYGMEAPIIGIAIGNVLAVAFTVIALRHDVRAAASLNDLRQIVRRGGAMASVTFSFYVIQLADVFFASRYLSPATVGVYRVAQRVGALCTYWTSSFHMAWGAMRYDALHHAADEDRGRQETAATLATYFLIATTGAIVFLSVLSEELVKIAAGSYAGAAHVIPLTAIAYSLQGVYVLVYRAAEFPRKRDWFIGLSIAGALSFVGASIALIPELGIYGPSTAVMIGWSVGIVGIYVLSQRGPDPVPYDYGRLVATIAVAGMSYLPTRLIEVGGWSGLGFHVACLAIYPVLLLATGIVPLRHVRTAFATVRANLRLRAEQRASGERLPGLSEEDFAAVDLLVRKGMPVDEAATIARAPESEMLKRLVRALRTLNESERAAQATDESMARYLLHTGTFADREAKARALFAEGADPIEMDRLLLLTQRLRRLKPDR